MGIYAGFTPFLRFPILRLLSRMGHLDLRRIGVAAKLAWPDTDPRPMCRAYAGISAFPANFAPEMWSCGNFPYNLEAGGLVAGFIAAPFSRTNDAPDLVFWREADMCLTREGGFFFCD